jgi:hypothetical protein
MIWQVEKSIHPPDRRDGFALGADLIRGDGDGDGGICGMA